MIYYLKNCVSFNNSGIVFREIQTLKESNRDLETKFSQRVSKYMELKRHLCNVNSKESMNTRVMEYVICLSIFLSHKVRINC